MLLLMMTMMMLMLLNLLLLRMRGSGSGGAVAISNALAPLEHEATSNGTKKILLGVKGVHGMLEELEVEMKRERL